MRLCEIVALVTGRKTESQRKLTDLHHQAEKPNLYTGLYRTYQPRDAEDTETLPDERQEVQVRATTVLEDLQKTMANVYDLVVSQDTGNTKAVADVVLADGTEILKAVPVTSLIYLEKQLEDLKTFYAKLPTLDPAKSWQKDADTRLYKSISRKHRTKRKKVPIVLFEATKEHPAQTQLIEEDAIVGDYTATEYSGALTANDKQALLERVRALKDAVVLAREKANQTEITQQRKAGEALFKFLHKGLA